MLSAYFVLRADLARRGIASKKSGEAETLIAAPCLAGFVGAKLYHLLESPAEFFADPIHLLLSPYGFAWFGGLLAGFATFAFVAWRLAKRSTANGQILSVLAIFDAGSPAAALGYGVGRIGCFLSGDGDYGIPTSLPWGMNFPQWSGAHHRARPPHSNLRTDRRLRNRVVALAHGFSNARFSSATETGPRLCGLSYSHRRGAFPRRVHPHQSPLISWGCQMRKPPPFFR